MKKKTIPQSLSTSMQTLVVRMMEYITATASTILPRPRSTRNCSRRRLLLNDDGTYRRDDIANFADKVSADNDTKSPNNFIREQKQIL